MEVDTPVGRTEPTSQTVDVPPTDVLESLYQLVRAGDRRGILQFLEEKTNELEEVYAPFFAQMTELAKAYQIRQIREIIKLHLDTEKSSQPYDIVGQNTACSRMIGLSICVEKLP